MNRTTIDKLHAQYVYSVKLMRPKRYGAAPHFVHAMTAFTPPNLQQPFRRRQRAMTLFELMVVVVISLTLVILAAISTRSLVTSTRVSAVKEEQRQLSSALRSYSLDHESYPSASQGLTQLARLGDYFSELPKDRFQDGAGQYVYLNASPIQAQPLVVSPGPDGDLDIPASLWEFVAVQEINDQLVPSYVKARAGKQAQKSPPVMGAARPSIVQPGSKQAQRKRLSEQQRQALHRYLQQNQYDPTAGSDGDIILSVE